MLDLSHIIEPNIESTSHESVSAKSNLNYQNSGCWIHIDENPPPFFEIPNFPSFFGTSDELLINPEFSNENPPHFDIPEFPSWFGDSEVVPHITEEIPEKSDDVDPQTKDSPESTLTSTISSPNLGTIGENSDNSRDSPESTTSTTSSTISSPNGSPVPSPLSAGDFVVDGIPIHFDNLNTRKRVFFTKELDLKEIAIQTECGRHNCRSVEFNGNGRHGVCIRLIDPHITGVFFASGVIWISGAKSMADVNRGMRKIIQIIEKNSVNGCKFDAKKTKLNCGASDPNLDTALRFKGVSAGIDVGFYLNLASLRDRFSDSCYAADDGDGLRFEFKGIKFCVFTTGRIRVWGAPGQQQVLDAFKELAPILKKHKAISLTAELRRSTKKEKKKKPFVPKFKEDYYSSDEEDDDEMDVDDDDESDVNIRTSVFNKSSFVPKAETPKVFGCKKCIIAQSDKDSTISALIKKKGPKSWRFESMLPIPQKITHLVCSTESRTKNVLFAIAYGAHIVNMDWLKDSLQILSKAARKIQQKTSNSVEQEQKKSQKQERIELAPEKNYYLAQFEKAASLSRQAHEMKSKPKIPIHETLTLLSGSSSSSDSSDADASDGESMSPRKMKLEMRKVEAKRKREENSLLFEGKSFNFDGQFDSEFDEKELKILVRECGAELKTRDPTYCVIGKNTNYWRKAHKDDYTVAVSTDFIFDAIENYEIPDVEDYDLSLKKKRKS